MRAFRFALPAVAVLVAAACGAGTGPTPALTVPLPTFVQGTATPTVAPTPTPSSATSPSPVAVGTPTTTPAATPSSSAAAGISGDWSGTWQDSNHPDLINGSFHVTFAQTGSTFTGTISVTNSCVGDGTVTGTIDSNGNITFGAVEGSNTVTFTGQVSGDSMSGSYTAPSQECGNGSGTWAATRD